MLHSHSTAIALANNEIVHRFGAAGAEYLKGLSGVDYATGAVFDRSLLKIHDYQLNQQFLEQNIKQQAGFSAEVAFVSKRNAEAVINRDSHRFSRSEDIASFGKNHQVVDIVELMEGNIASEMQMKFVSNVENQLRKIAHGSQERYQRVKLGLPSEQVAHAKQFCQQQAENFSRQAEAMQAKGNFSQAADYRKRAENYQNLQNQIEDTGISTEQAIAYRLNPRWETAKDIAAVSHQAGLAGAKMGAAIGGGMAAVCNVFAVASGDKEFGEALTDTAFATLHAAGIGYASAAGGSALSSLMQQSANTTIRRLSATALPALAVSTCLAMGSHIARFVNGEIDGGELSLEMGKTAASTVTASHFATLGQIAIPVPILGSLIGGMIGYAICNGFFSGFQGILNSLDEAKQSAQQYQFIRLHCEVAKQAAARYQHYLETLFAHKLQQFELDAATLFAAMKNPDLTADQQALAINQFAATLGKKLPIKNRQELDEFMATHDTLKL